MSAAAPTGKVRLYMSMSVDGFITGPDDGPDHGLGVGGERFDEMMATGAVVTGRRTFEFARGWSGDHHDGVPVFVLTRSVPNEPAPGHARYVTDVGSCVAQAREAAGGRDVLVHGAAAAQSCLQAGQLDEIELQLVPVLLGQGRRLFDGMSPDHVELELLRSLRGSDVLHLRYRVQAGG